MERTLRFTSIVLLLAAAAAFPAQGALLRPFLYGGVQRITWEKEEYNALLDLVTYRDGSNSWEAGGGLRILARKGGDAISPLSFCARFGIGHGNLPGETISGRRFDGRSSFSYTSKESYDYSWWSFSPALMIEVRPELSFSIGPAVQRVKFNAVRDWTGPSGFYETGNAKDEARVYYGLLDLGARVQPLSIPVFAEADWAPFRARLSTSHTFKSDNWTTATFSSFDHSLAFHLGYEF